MRKRKRVALESKMMRRREAETRMPLTKKVKN